jgi:tRNA(fMet)-specific endonuclease VapC
VTLYLLDTNTASYLIRSVNSSLNEKANRYHPQSLCLSVVTEAEMRFGIVRNPQASRLARLVSEFLNGIDILPWDSTAANAYALLKSRMQGEGLSLSALDLLIAAHALSRNATLVTSDRAFYKIGHLAKLEDWSNA